MPFNCPHCTKEIDQGAIVDRINSLGKERDELAGKLKDAEKGSKLAEKLAGQVEALTGQLAEVKEQHAVELALSDAGITDADVRDAFQWQYGRLPVEEGKSKAPFADVMKGWKEKPADAPAVLRPFLGPADKGKPGGGGKPAGAGTGGGRGTPGNGGQGRNDKQIDPFDPATVAAMSTDELRANLGQISTSWGFGAPAASLVKGAAGAGT